MRECSIVQRSVMSYPFTSTTKFSHQTTSRVRVNLIYVVITQQYEQIIIFKGAVTVSVVVCGDSPLTVQVLNYRRLFFPKIVTLA